MRGVCWFLAKCGSLNWADAPFSPHLSAGFKDLVPPPNNSNLGTAITIVMIDARTNIVKAIRLVGLGNEFSCNLHKAISELAAQPYNEEEFNKAIYDTQHIYPVKKLVQMATERYRLK